MKKLSYSAIAIFFSLAINAQAQTQGESLGLPGDNFDLYGALDLFKDSKNAESFERSLNSQDNKINNLDLNADGKVDYIKVVDRSTGDTKILILQDVISENESQDVAVIEMEKRGNDLANLQIVGDEALYGKDYIIVPQEEQQPAPNTNKVRRTNVYVNVWAWPGVNWVYAPTYTVWVSPYYWSVYPMWWSPWSPLGWDVYYPGVYGYHHPFYHRAHEYYLPHAHREYYGHRTSSVTVINRDNEMHHRDDRSGRNESPGRGRNENQGRPNRDVKNGHNEAQPRGKSQKANDESRGDKGNENQGRPNHNVKNGQNEVQPNRGESRPQREEAQPRGKGQNPTNDSRGGNGSQNHGSPRGGSGRQEQPAHQNHNGSGNGNGGARQGGHSGGNNSGGKRGR